MYDVFYFYMLFIYNDKPHLNVRQDEDGVRVSTIVCSKHLVAWHYDAEEAIRLIATEAVRLIKEDQRPYDDFEKQVWGME